MTERDPLWEDTTVNVLTHPVCAEPSTTPSTLEQIIASMRENVRQPDGDPDEAVIWSWRVDEWADALAALRPSEGPETAEIKAIPEYREGLYRRGFKAGFNKAVAVGRGGNGVSLDTLIKVEQYGIEKGMRDSAALPAGPETTTALRRHRFDCPECGKGIAVDEDGCCRTCGEDAQPVTTPAAGPETGDRERLRLADDIVSQVVARYKDLPVPSGGSVTVYADAEMVHAVLVRQAAPAASEGD